MTRYHANLVGWGMSVPDNVLTNDDLAQMVDTSDEWIRSRSGIVERHIVEEGETTKTMSVDASRKALDRAGLTAQDLDLILIATSSPDEFIPPVSSRIQHELGAQCGAMTLIVGCTGFLYGLVTASQFIATGAAKNVLVVGVETISRNLDWSDRTTCVLFGDGAGAVVLQATETPCGVQSHLLGSDGAGADHLIAPGVGARTTMTTGMIERGEHFLRMNGREVFKFATGKMVESLAQVMGEAGVSADDIDLFIPHQANRRIIEYAAQQAGFPMDKVYINLDRYGNTSAASVPLALNEALDQGLAGPGDTLALVAFGSGLTWGATIFELGSMQSEENLAAMERETVAA
ncbi:MAG: beta-ketoacyl-ACP synthase III [Bacteroidota bacterium]